jgi:tetratricopeptide (TPR) repeat protein
MDHQSSSVNECQHCNLLSNTAATNTVATKYLVRKPPVATAPQQQQYQQLATLQQLQQQQQQQETVLDELMALMRDLGSAYCALKQYECEQALSHLARVVSPSQLNSPLCLALKAKCHFELHQYALAESSYSLMHRLYPYHLDGIDYYSTTLWHLQKVCLITFIKDVNI